MKIIKAFIIGMIALLIGGGNAHAVTIPSCGKVWPTYGSNNARTRTCHDPRLEGHLHIQWTQPSWGVIEFPPIYVNGVLFMDQDSGRLSARSAATGQIIWQHIIAPEPLSPVYSNGVLITPAGTTLNAYRAATGQLIWSQPWSRSESSPLVVGSTVYDANSHGYVIARNRDTGHWIWAKRLSAGEAPWLPMLYFNALPTLVHCGGSHGGGTTTLPFADRFTAALTYRNGIIYAVNYAGDIWALGLKGNVIWHKQYPLWLSDYSTPSVAGSALFVTSRDGYIARINAYNGSLIWLRKTGTVTYGSPAIDRGSVYTSDLTGGFWRFNESSGNPTWHKVLPSGYTLSSPVVLGGRVFFDAYGVCGNSIGVTYGFQLGTMKTTFFYNEGKYQPGIDANGRFILTGQNHLYSFVQ